MDAIRIQSNTSERIDAVLLDSSGDPVTGLAGAQLNMLTLLRESDDKYWDGDSWETAKTDLAMTEQDATNSPGLYFYVSEALPEDSYTFTLTTSEAYNSPQIGQILAGDYTDNLDAAISDVLADVADILTDTANILLDTSEILDNQETLNVIVLNQEKLDTLLFTIEKARDSAILADSQAQA